MSTICIRIARTLFRVYTRPSCKATAEYARDAMGIISSAKMGCQRTVVTSHAVVTANRRPPIGGFTSVLLARCVRNKNAP